MAVKGLRVMLCYIIINSYIYNYVDIDSMYHCSSKPV